MNAYQSLVEIAEIPTELLTGVRPERYRYHHGYKSNLDAEHDPGMWHCPLVGKEYEGAFEDCSGELDTTTGIDWAKPIWQWVLDRFGERGLIRMYLNAQGPMDCGCVHIDDDREADHGQRVETIMFYLNEVWHPDMGGETVFFADVDKIYGAVLPKFGRVVKFAGDMPHTGRAPSRFAYEQRFVLVFKTFVAK